MKATANYAWPQYDGSCPYLVDEFGGIKWVKDQEKQATDSQTESWGYGQAPRTLEEFYTRLEGQVDALLSLSGQVWGYCYTQLTDVEQEQNGIYCYDRSAKFDMDRIKAIFSKRPITRRTAARPNEAHPENPERDFGVRFLSGSSSSARGRASCTNAPGNRRRR